LRVVIAIEPAIPVAERIVLLQEDLTDPFRLLGAEVEWTPAERLRLVLGTVVLEERLLGHVRDQLRARLADVAPVRFETTGALFVPDTSSPRLLAVGTGGGAEALTSLHELVAALLSEVGAPLPDRPWKPWMQVARLRTGPTTSPLDGTVRPYSETQFGATDADEVLLGRAEVTAGAPRHTVVDRIVLGA
jgi:2'-5' RNA ligase